MNSFNNYEKILILLLIIIVICAFVYYNAIETFVPVDALTEYKHIKHNVDFFKKVIDFLEKNKITYWGTCGTLLGTMRDRGMIPWDDDSDIAIPRDQIGIIESYLSDLKAMGIGWCPIFFGYKFYDLGGTVVDGQQYKYPFVDVFVVIENNDGDKWIYETEKTRQMWPREYYPKNEVFPLKKYKYEYYEILSMSNPYPFLDRAYPDWRLKAIKTYDHINEKQVKRIEFPIEYNINKKPFLWVYWDNIGGGKTPPLIELCFTTVLKNCEKSFDIVKLDNNNILNYLPELKEYSKYVDVLKIAHKVDLYRIMLLYKYGGLYIDADTIVLKDPIEIMSKLDKHDYIGYGCTGNKCKNGYGKPSNGIMASRPNSYLMGKIMMNILDKIKSINIDEMNNNYKFDYFYLGKHMIWKQIEDVDEYEYYHYDNKFDGTRDKFGSWVTTSIIFSNTPIEYDNEDDMIFFTLYNSEISANIKRMSADELLATDWNVTKYLKKGLHL